MGVTEGDVIHIQNNYLLHVANLKHSLPCVGYVLKQQKKKLLPKFQLNPTMIKSARKNGEQVDQMMEESVLAYLCDTNAERLLELFSNGSPAPTVIVECTFLGQDDSTVKLADSKFHVDWFRLEKLVRKFPEVRFILMHFSLRYKDEQIIDHFKQYTDLHNVVLWLDSGIVELKNQ